MRFAFAAITAVLAFASSVVAQTYPSLSYYSLLLLCMLIYCYTGCALPCLASADFGTCGQTNTTCLCDSSNFVNSVTSCITQQCTSPTDLQAAEQAAQANCASAVSSPFPLSALAPVARHKHHLMMCKHPFPLFSLYFACHADHTRTRRA